MGNTPECEGLYLWNYSLGNTVVWGWGKPQLGGDSRKASEDIYMPLYSYDCLTYGKLNEVGLIVDV